MSRNDGFGGRPVVATALNGSRLPLELVERFQRQPVTQAEAAGNHPHRQQRFLDLGAWTAQ
ncbi:hypothetical protein D3C87_1707340 [compost metagenome]